MGDGTKLADLTAAEQTAVLQSLRQTAAAWLLGMSPRALRDCPDAPRSAKGRYIGRELVTWAAGRLERPDLSNTDRERLLVIAEYLEGEISSDTALRRIVEMLRELKGRYGVVALVELVEILLTTCGTVVDANPPPTAEELQQTRLEQHQREERQVARNELRICVVCEDCRRLRCGSRWVRAKGPADHVISLGLCPECADKSANQQRR